VNPTTFGTRPVYRDYVAVAGINLRLR